MRFSPEVRKMVSRGLVRRHGTFLLIGLSRANLYSHPSKAAGRLGSQTLACAILTGEGYLTRMQGSDRKIERLCLALLFAIFVWFTWRGLTMFYTGDDLMNTYAAWQLRPLKIVEAEFFLWMPSYRPLGALIYRAFYWAFGFHPEPLYVFCWLLLCFNVFAAFRFFKAVMNSGQDALIALAITLIHGNLRDLYLSSGTLYDRLWFLFTVLAVTLYVRARRDGTRMATGTAALVCLLSVLAMDSKESGVTLIAILAAWEFIFILPGVYRSNRIRQWLRSIAPLYSVLLVLSLVFVFGRVRHSTEIAIDTYRPHFSASVWLSRVSWYFGILAYGHVSFQPLSTGILLGLLLLAALALRNRAMLFGWLFFVITITPVALISIRLGYVLYVPALGLGLYFGALIGAAMRALARRTRWRSDVCEAAAFGVCLLVLLWFHVRNWPANFNQRTSPELRLTEQFRREYPKLPKGSRLLFDSDDFPPDSFDLLTNLRLLYGDRTLIVNRTHAMPDQQPDWSASPQYDHVFALEPGRYVELDPSNVPESIRLHILRDYGVGRHLDFGHRDHGAYVVSGVKDFEGDDAGRWTSPHAVLKFDLYPADSTFSLKFWVPDVVAAPPLRTLSIRVNGAPIGSLALNKVGYTLVNLDVDKPYTQDGEQFGVVLLQCGFEYDAHGRRHD
jgi:hypothetical protein